MLATLPRSVKRALCLLLAVPIAIGGCGGGDDSSSDTSVLTPTVSEPAPPSRDEFITSADGICAEVNAAIGGLESSDTSSGSADDQRADLYTGMMERIRGLGTPTDDSGLQGFLDAGDALVDAEQGGDPVAISSAEAEFASAADSFGFQDCGQGPSSPSSSTTAPAPSAPATPVTPAAPTVPVAPAAPAPAPAPAPPSGGTGGAGGGTGGGGTGGTSGGSGGVGPG